MCRLLVSQLLVAMVMSCGTFSRILSRRQPEMIFTINSSLGTRCQWLIVDVAPTNPPSWYNHVRRGCSITIYNRLQYTFHYRLLLSRTKTTFMLVLNTRQLRKWMMKKKGTKLEKAISWAAWFGVGAYTDEILKACELCLMEEACEHDANRMKWL